MGEAERTGAALALLFAAGTRPTASDVEAALSSADGPSAAARVTHRPPADQGWLELLARGLAFDMRGLVPAPAEPLPPAAHFYGVPAGIEGFEWEAVTLAPGAHVAAGGALLPLVRTLVGIAAGLALGLPAKVVCWQPARCWMDPAYFARLALGWLAGGPFPALGLTAIERLPDGAVRSEGLAFFIGKELHVPAAREETGPETIRLAASAIDQLVGDGGLAAPLELRGPDGQVLVAEPRPDGRMLLLRR